MYYSFVLRPYSNTITQTSSLCLCHSPLQTCFQSSLSPPPLHTPIWIFSDDFFKVSSGQIKGSLPRSHRILSPYHVIGHQFYGTTFKPGIVSGRTSQVWWFSVQSLWFFGLLFPLLILCVSGLHLGWRPALHNWPTVGPRKTSGCARASDQRRILTGGAAGDQPLFGFSILGAGFTCFVLT